MSKKLLNLLKKLFKKQKYKKKKKTMVGQLFHRKTILNKKRDDLPNLIIFKSNIKFIYLNLIKLFLKNKSIYGPLKKKKN